jgi:hypothetical protein
VRYNPKDPADAVIEDATPTNDVVMGCAVLGFGAFLLWVER